ncbi:MAG: hypothetical protein KF873_05725 [Gemmataceae bacterium]|nr:hypothetical protein [Gemmataceae bacterium]
MPIRLLLVNGRGPISGPEFSALADQLLAQGVTVASYENPVGNEPWAIFERMRVANVFPPGAVMVAAANADEVTAAKNAGTWAVGVTDSLVASGSPPPSEDDRNRYRSMFLDAGADAAVDAVSELADAIKAIDGLM